MRENDKGFFDKFINTFAFVGSHNTCLMTGETKSEGYFLCIDTKYECFMRPYSMTLNTYLKDFFPEILDNYIKKNLTLLETVDHYLLVYSEGMIFVFI
jgi:hypothetical protein